VLSLLSCPLTPGEHIRRHWMGGLAGDAPPRQGTSEYDAWMTKRSQQTEQQEPK